MPSSGFVHILVVDYERRSIFVDIIIAYVTCTSFGGSGCCERFQPYSVQKYARFCFSIAVLLIMARQNAKWASNHSSTRSQHHQAVSVPRRRGASHSTSTTQISFWATCRKFRCPCFPFQCPLGPVRLSPAPLRRGILPSSSVPHLPNT